MFLESKKKKTHHIIVSHNYKVCFGMPRGKMGNSIFPLLTCKKKIRKTYNASKMTAFQYIRRHVFKRPIYGAAAY